MPNKKIEIPEDLYYMAKEDSIKKNIPLYTWFKQAILSKLSRNGDNG